MNRCPHCAEVNQDSATICQFCGRELVKPNKVMRDKGGRSVWKTLLIMWAVMVFVACIIVAVITSGALLVQTIAPEYGILVYNLLNTPEPKPPAAQIERAIADCTSEDIERNYGLILWKSAGDILDYGDRPSEHIDKWAGWVPCRGSPVIIVRAQIVSGGHQYLLVKYGEQSGWVHIDAVIPTTSEYVAPTPR